MKGNKRFDANKVQAELREAFSASYTVSQSKAAQDAARESLAKHLMSAAVLCDTAAVFKAQMDEFGAWLKTEPGVTLCNSIGITLAFDAEGKPKLPATFKQYSSNIHRGMLRHEDPTIKQNGKALVGHVSEFTSEGELRKATAAPLVKELVELSKVQAREGLSESERESAAHEVKVRITLNQRLDSLKQQSLALTGDRMDDALVAVNAALTTVTALWDAQRQELAAAEQAKKDAADGLPEAGQPGAKVANG